MNIFQILQWVGVGLWIIYLLLAVQENIACWIFGMMASAVTIINFYHSKIYSEAILNLYYIGAAVYGWYYWSIHQKNAGQSTAPVTTWSRQRHLYLYIMTAIVALIWGTILHRHTDSPRPYIDACTASFSFLTTFMEARKVLTTWVNWFCINIVLVFLQIDRDIPVYAALSGFFALMSIRGFYRWRKSYLRMQTTHN